MAGSIRMVSDRCAASGTDAPHSGAGPQAVSSGELMRRYEQLARRHTVELRLSGVAADGGGISGLIREMARLSANPLWLIDPRGRVVARSEGRRGSNLQVPDLALLLDRLGPVDPAAVEPLIARAEPARGIARRHLVMPVRREESLYAWIVVAEVSERFIRQDAALATRAAFHLASEYAVQRRIARASWNARSALARQLIRGSARDDDIVEAAEYLGVRADADRVVVYLAHGADGPVRDEEDLCEELVRELGVEVLSSHGREGTVLLVEVREDASCMAFVHEVKQATVRVLARLGKHDVIVGVSAVSSPGALQRSYHETREVALCVDRFSGSGDRVVAVDDLGPARLFVANSDVASVRRYVQDVLGPLLDGAAGTADLLKTLQFFFDAGRSVRGTAARLGVHENTVRLRLAKVHDLTDLDVASDANHQLSAQTALLVLRLQGHPSIPGFAERRGRAAAVRGARALEARP